jgi:hypothetical protein
LAHRREIAKLRQIDRKNWRSSVNSANIAMAFAKDILSRVQAAESGLTLAACLTQRPSVARRTAQRQTAKLK